MRAVCGERTWAQGGCESLDLVDPVGDVGEDARVDGVSAVKPQLASPIRTQNR